MSFADAFRYLGALTTLVVGVMHVHQYADFISDVPTIAELFLLNGVGAGVVVVLLATRVAPLGALGGIGLSLGALVSIVIAMTPGGLFDYQEPSFRTPVTIAIVAEAAAVLLLLAYLVRRRSASSGSPSAEAPW